MAEFNPDVPKIPAPDWLGLSRSISQPAPDTSTASLIEGVSHVLDSGIKAADWFVKSNLEDQIHAGIDSIRNPYTDSLKATDAAFHGGGTTGQVQRDDGSLLPSSGTEKPPIALNNLPGSLNTLHSAKANGKLSETDYLGRLDTLAKDFRSRYPGYRDYIDQQFEKISGVNPANAQIKSLVSDINSYMAQANEQKNKTLNWAVEHMGDIPNGPEMIQQFINGQIDGNALRVAAYPRIKDAAQFKYNHEVMGDWKESKEKKAVFAHQAATEVANNIASSDIEVPFIVAGFKDPQKLSELFSQTKNRDAISSEAWTSLGQSMQARTLAVSANIDKVLNTKDAQGDSAATMLTPDQISKLKSEAMSAHNLYKEAIINKDLGQAFTTSLLTAAGTRDNVKKVLDDPTIGGVTRLIASLNAAGGGNPEFMKVMYEALVRANIPTVDKPAITALMVQLSGQPNLNNLLNPAATGVPTTFKETMERADKAGLGKEGQNAIIKLTDIISNPAPGLDPLKINVAKAAFSEGNRGMLDLFKNDRVENGRRIPGRNQVFDDVTKPDNLKELHRLGEQDRTLWPAVKLWVGRSFASDIYSGEIKSLNANQGIPYLQLGWDNKTSQIIHKDRLPDENNPSEVSKYYSAGTQQDIKLAKESIGRLNRGLANVANVYKQEGSDPNGYTIQLLKNLGVGGFTDRWLSAVENTGLKASQSPNKPRTEVNNDWMTSPIREFTNQDNSPTLESWLSNPTLGNTSRGRSSANPLSQLPPVYSTDPNNRIDRIDVEDLGPPIPFKPLKRKQP